MKMNDDTRKGVLPFCFVVFMVILIKKVGIPQMFFILEPDNAKIEYQYYSAMLQYGTLMLGSVFLNVIYSSKENTLSEDMPLRKKLFEGMNSVVIGILSFFIMLFSKDAIRVIISSIARVNVIASETTCVSKGAFLLMVVVQAFWAPISEEMWFRGGLYKVIRLKSNVFALVFSVTLFSLEHQTLEQKIQALFLGLLFCFIYSKTNSIYQGVIIHIVYNFLGAVQACFFYDITILNQINVNVCSKKMFAIIATTEIIITIACIVLLCMVVCKRYGRMKIMQDAYGISMRK